MIEFFVRRPIFATVCSLIIILAGLIAIPNLPIAQYPDIASPQVTVTCNYNGASAEVVEAAVTTVLEQEINGVEGMRYMTSTSTNDGTSSITITFNPGRNIDNAVVDVQNRVATAQARLPAEVKAIGVNISKNSSALVLVYGLYAEKNQYSNFFISNYADRFIKDSLKRIKGVGQVTIFGERKYAMRLWLDPNKLAARGLTGTDVIRALQEQNVEVAAGQIGQPPNEERQSYQMSVRAIGRLENPEQFNDLILKTTSEGQLVRLRDVGRTELGAETYGSTLRFLGQNAVGLGIFQLPNTNALDVGNDVKAQMKKLVAAFPPGLKTHLAIDTTKVITDSINEVLWTLGIAILLVVAVIFLFLQNWRTTLIPAITIPVSLIGAFAFLKLFGFSINTLTLFGLTLATGLVVDDAIVVVENIERFMQEKGMSPFQATLEGVKEVFGAVIATSLVLVAVFVPVAFFPGTTGALYKQFALTIAFSIALSAFNALTLTPALAAFILKPKAHRENRFFAYTNQGINALRDGYHKLLQGVLHHKGWVIIAFLAMIGGTYLLFKIVPSGFIPNEDQGYFITIVQGPEGTSLNQTHKAIAEIEKVFKKIPEIYGSFSVGGFSFSGNGPNKAMVFGALIPQEYRNGAGHSTKDIINRIRGPLMGIPNAMVIPFEPPAIRGVGSFGGFQFEVKDESGHDLNTLFQTSQALIGKGNQNPALNQLFTSFTANDPQLKVYVDRFKAKALNVSLQEIFSTLQIFLGSQYVNDFNFLNRVYRVYVQADQQFRANPANIGQFYVRSNQGQMVPMSNLVKVEQTYTPQIINHYNLFRSVEISGGPKPGYSSGQAIETMESLAHQILPQGMSYEWSGLALEELESGSKAAFIFILSFVFVFLVLAAQYESFVEPLIILLAVPLAIFGALFAQWVRGIENDIFCQIGLVMLIGLASKNAILIVEFANQLRDEGVSIAEAAVRAAQIRFRPIIMTSLAFILGIMPLVIASGAGSASRHSMGTAVLGGMVVSTLLSLFLVPVLYILAEWGKERFRRKPVH